jgi:N-acetylmuramoyl-L-alanine amidase
VLLDRPQRTADSAVLTAPDVPSALVELGCLSNPVEERLLQQHTYQKRLARGLVRSIEGYFAADAARLSSWPGRTGSIPIPGRSILESELWHSSLEIKPASSAEGPKVRRLAAGGRWIRTIGPRHERAGFYLRKANCGTERGSQKGCFLCGTDGSNPSPSSGESATNRSPRPRDAAATPVCLDLALDGEASRLIVSLLLDMALLSTTASGSVAERLAAPPQHRRLTSGSASRRSRCSSS